MIRSIGDYIDIVGTETISRIYKKTNKLYGKRIANVNATFLGGGVGGVFGVGAVWPVFGEAADVDHGGDRCGRGPADRAGAGGL